MPLPGQLPSRRRLELTGRDAERGALDGLARAVSGGGSGALVLHGEAGVGKTALLEYLTAHAAGCQVTAVAGVESEMELPYAGLHQLCGPFLGHLNALPAPQAGALRIAFGMSGGPAPDRFLVGLAVLSLLSQAAGQSPLLCIIDDFQWLDHASAQALAFAARRLGTESVGIVFATRQHSGDLVKLPQLEVAGLRAAEARALLDAVLPGPIDSRVRDRLIAEARGNPLALLELPRGLSAEDLAGGFGLPRAVPVAESVERSFRHRIEALPQPTRHLLLLAGADPSGDPALVWRAAAVLGIDTQAALPAIDEGLAEFGAGLTFCHPLARSAAYRSATAVVRREAHRALAEVTDPGVDPDRRAWHRAEAAPGPDEDVAAELERSADRARSRGGTAAAAAFLERAATLTPDPVIRAMRALAAAQAKIQAGAYGAAANLISAAEALPLTALQRAHTSLARAQLAYFTRRGPEAPPLLLDAARMLEDIDPGLSRATYLDALSATMFAGRLAPQGYGTTDVVRAMTAAPPPPGAPRAPDLLLDGLIADHRDGFGSGAALLHRSLEAFGNGVLSAEEELHWLWPACFEGAVRLWDDLMWDTLSARQTRLARETGALSELPRALTSRAYVHLLNGEMDTAGALAEEILTGADETRMGLAPALWLAALRGDEPKAQALSDAIMEQVARRGEGVAIRWVEWTTALLNNGLGYYGKAAAPAWQASTDPSLLGPSVFSLPELIEAAVRTGLTDTAEWGRTQMEKATRGCATDWGLGIRARCLALVSDGAAAEELHREAVTRLGRTRLRPDLARAHLLYGEWLVGERRRAEARAQLRSAQHMFDQLGMAGFAGRAGRELRSVGVTAGKRAPAAPHQELTAQEALIARLAREGMSNPQIGARLFISASTAQYHLKKVFVKLGITSRTQLNRVLPP